MAIRLICRCRRLFWARRGSAPMFFIYAVAFVFCFNILSPSPCVQAQSNSASEQPDEKGLDPQASSNTPGSLAAYVDQVSGIGVEELVRMALVRNAELEATRRRTAEAQAQLLQARLRPNPGFEVSVTNGRILGSPGERDITLGYAHVFELGGKRERRVRAAQIGSELAELEVAERERQLKADVKARFGEALAAARNLETAEQLLDLNRQILKITEARVREGEAAPLEQGLLQVEVSRIESDRLLFENQVARALLELKTLAGMNSEEPLRISGDLSVSPVTISLAESVERALAKRPDLEALRLEEKLREAEIELARAEALPNLIGFARYTRSSSAFDQFGLSGTGRLVPLRDTDNLFTAGVSITLPVLNRNQGQIQAAIARGQAARLRRQFLEQVIRREVRAAYSRYETARRALEIFDQRVLGQSQENLRIIRAAYNFGELRLLDVINEQRRLTDTQKAYTEVLKEYYLAIVALERAVGASLK